MGIWLLCFNRNYCFFFQIVHFTKLQYVVNLLSLFLFQHGEVVLVDLAIQKQVHFMSVGEKIVKLELMQDLSEHTTQLYVSSFLNYCL